MPMLTAALIATAFALPTAAAYADHHESSNTGSANTGAHSTKVEGGTAAGHEGGMVQDDADRNTETTMESQVFGLPTLILFKGGKPLERMQGYQPKHRIVHKFEPHLDKAA